VGVATEAEATAVVEKAEAVTEAEAKAEARVAGTAAAVRAAARAAAAKAVGAKADTVDRTRIQQMASPACRTSQSSAG